MSWQHGNEAGCHNLLPIWWKDEHVCTAEFIPIHLALAAALKAAGVPCLHFYTMGKAEPTARIAKEVF